MPAELSPLEMHQTVIFRLRGTDDGSFSFFTINIAFIF
ncbi:hypothetical protein AmaxDRAFT_0844 [Limnospira maxima CS-328]|uniref:Uncharacterized protein n=1 Tax=Limnospira maxima CS-328 TaxID=513049 RepID=B5VWF2_LIMMA|nr:hypothetical protein AmaxDRAFT_0844 [Limnospira maxima CS-328]